MRYRLNIAYDGTHFCGWQRQKNGPSIQETIESVLAQILQCPVPITGAGRTDAGVHATAQSAHFDCEKKIDPPKLLLSLNSLLPKSIRIFDLFPTQDDFHARFSASAKTYTYYLRLSTFDDPFTAPYAYRPKGPINLAAIRVRAKELLGTHDFTTFANIGTPTKDNIRTIYSIDIQDTPSGIALIFTGNGFLYKMVRNLVSVLLSDDNIPELLAKKDRKAAPPPAPPHGLFLTEITYSKAARKVSPSTAARVSLASQPI